MKYKKIYAFIIGISLLATGCSSVNPVSSSSSSVETTASQISEAQSGADSNNSAAQNQPEEAQLEENQSQVMGKVTSISEAEITIALVEMQNTPPQGGGPSDDKQAQGSAPSRSSGAANSAPPEGNLPQNSGNTEGSDVSRPDMGAKPDFANESVLTGESVTYALSADVEISGANGNETPAITDITTDTLVRLISEKNADGSETVIKIQLLSFEQPK